MDRLKGTGVALVTPMNSDLQIDYSGLGKLLEFTAEKGADYYVVMGTTGESATLTSKERLDVLRFVRDNNKAGLPIVYGIGGNNTMGLLREIEETDLTGVDALLSISPYYNKPSQKGIIAHFETLASASPVPVILYNVPGRTASNLTSATTLKLAEHGNIIGIKESAGDLEQAMQIVAGKPQDFMLISGDDMLTVPIYRIGGSGVISVLSNAYADVFSQIRKAVEKGETHRAASEASALFKINPLMYEEANPVGIKFVLSELKICEPYVRLPLLHASESLQNRIRHAMGDM